MLSIRNPSIKKLVLGRPKQEFSLVKIVDKNPKEIRDGKKVNMDQFFLLLSSIALLETLEECWWIEAMEIKPSQHDCPTSFKGTV